uniref:Uncharacterized protein n=1 Tax=Triticum urartu TaxID=4572 RepID=A0A8R7U2E6_TRIUA
LLHLPRQKRKIPINKHPAAAPRSKKHHRKKRRHEPWARRGGGREAPGGDPEARPAAARRLLQETTSSPHMALHSDTQGDGCPIGNQDIHYNFMRKKFTNNHCVTAHFLQNFHKLRPSFPYNTVVQFYLNVDNFKKMVMFIKLLL